MNETVTYSPEFQRLLDIWRCATDSNDPKAQFNLAKFYLQCKRADTYKKAFVLFKKLANQSYTTVQTDAQYMLGKCYENGCGIQKSYPRAIRWYKTAGHNICSDLSTVYKAFEKEISDKIDTALDPLDSRIVTSELVDYLTDAAESGDVEVQKCLMYLYRYGDGYFESDYKEDAYLAEKAAEKGDVKAMNRIGHMYYYGQGVERNFRKGLDWLEMAAEHGCGSSAYQLGKHNESMTANKVAAEWYRKYAESEIRWRNNRLGWKPAT